jgi:hypothetical protein
MTSNTTSFRSSTLSQSIITNFSIVSNTNIFPTLSPPPITGLTAFPFTNLTTSKDYFV